MAYSPWNNLYNVHPITVDSFILKMATEITACALGDLHSSTRPNPESWFIALVTSISFTAVFHKVLHFSGSLCKKARHTKFALFPCVKTDVRLYNTVRGWGGTNPSARSPMWLRFCTVAPNIFESSVWNFLQITFWPHELRWLQNILKMCAPLQ
jgi:hypothetical protein